MAREAGQDRGPVRARRSSDQLARLLAPELSATFGQTFYIENRGGSSGAIGAALVANSAPTATR